MRVRKSRAAEEHEIERNRPSSNSREAHPTLVDAYLVSRRQRKKVEMLFAHLKRILKLDRLRLRGPNGAKDEFHLAAAAQNLRKMANMVPIRGLAPP